MGGGPWWRGLIAHRDRSCDYEDAPSLPTEPFRLEIVPNERGRAERQEEV